MDNAKTNQFTRKQITQHKEVLQDGLFKSKVIKKNKKTIIENKLKEEAEQELNSYLKELDARD